MFDSAAIKSAWEKYVAGGAEIPDIIEGVRQEIVDSWRRCQKTVDPFCESLPYVSEEELDERLEKNAILVNIAYPYLLKFYECLSGTNHQFMLADKNGCQLKIISEGDILNEMSETKGFINGKLYGEMDMGTNGIGTCLTLEKPVMIRGPEHYHVLFDNVCCYGAPIYDPTSHKLIGCINITGPLEFYNPMIMAMLQAAIKGIEKEFELSKANNMLNFISDNNVSGILLVDQRRTIIHNNKSAVKLLQLKENEIINRNLRDIVAPGSLPAIFENLKNPITNQECTILNKNGISLELCVSIIPQKDNIRGFSATLIKFDSQLYVHHLTNQIAGFFASYTFDSLAGKSDQLDNVKQLGKIAAGFDSPVLIVGETGTGKEILAQAIHNESSRKDEPFITVNCETVPKAKLDDDLWGYESTPYILGKEKGKPGKIELANGGTLFLNNIGSMPLETQVRFLSFLRTKQFMRAGGKYPKTSNIRIIGSSTVNLLSIVEKKMFRSDLYYMLCSFNITIPPLRERPEDIIVLSHKYAQQYNASKQPVTFDRESIEALLNYHWAGNMRQLESVIEGAVNVASKSVIRLPNLPLDIINEYYSNKHSAGTEDMEIENNDKLLRTEIKEYNKILYAVKKTDGNVKESAKILNMPLSTLYRKLTKYEIDPKEYKN